jgi:hypothetical protein
MRVAPSIPFPALVGIWNYRYRCGGGGCGDAGLVLAVVAVVVACTLGGAILAQVVGTVLRRRSAVNDGSKWVFVVIKV